MTQPRKIKGAGSIAHSGRALYNCASRDRIDDKSEQVRGDHLNPNKMAVHPLDALSRARRLSGGRLALSATSC